MASEVVERERTERRALVSTLMDLAGTEDAGSLFQFVKRLPGCQECVDTIVARRHEMKPHVWRIIDLRRLISVARRQNG